MILIILNVNAGSGRSDKLYLQDVAPGAKVIGATRLQSGPDDAMGAKYTTPTGLTVVPSNNLKDSSSSTR